MEQWTIHWFSLQHVAYQLELWYFHPTQVLPTVHAGKVFRGCLVVGNSCQACANPDCLFMQVSQARSSSETAAVDKYTDVSEGQTDFAVTSLKPKIPEIELSQQEGVSSTLRLPDVA